MKKIHIESSGLLLLSGPSGSGKTRLLSESNIPSEMIVSSDALRKQFFGTQKAIVEGNWVNEPSDTNDAFIFQMMETIVEQRLRNKLMTFVDATLLTDSDRKPFVNLANKYRQRCYTLIFDYPDHLYLEHNKNRLYEQHDNSVAVSSQVVKNQLSKFQRDSELSSYVKINDSINLVLTPKEIDMNSTDLHLNYDVLGDTHGLFDETVSLLSKNGYQIDKDNLSKGITHPENRKLIVLGDFCDRGPGDLKMIQLMMRASSQGHKIVLGNHENKLKNALQEYLQTNRFPSVPDAAKVVLSKITKLKRDEQKTICNFLDSLPHYLTLGKYAFTHAPLSFFDPLKTSMSKCVYGNKRDDKDFYALNYDNGFEKGHNKYILMHGHIPHPNNQSEYIFSFDNHVGQGGDLHLIKLDEFDSLAKEMGSNRKAFSHLLQIEKSGFDFNNEKDEKLKLVRQIGYLSKEKNKERLFFTNEGDYGMQIIKYSPNVHFNNLWDKHPLLHKARGLVLDSVGNICQHPFDKVFNYKENDAGKELSPTDTVICPVKLNGFLGVVSAHPFKSGQALFTTTGSFDSDYVEYFKQSFTKDEMIGIMRYTGTHKEVSLMFEVIHPNDPHIIKYPEEMMGVHLIGARKKDWDAPLYTEQALDDIAKEIGVKRPQWERMTFAEVIERNKTFNDEGFMVRLDNEQQDMVLKLKSPLYLMTKFMGRLVDTKSDFMFKRLDVFSKDIEEEGAMIAKAIVENFTLDEWKTMNNHKRVEAVGELVKGIIKIDDTLSHRVNYDKAR